MKSYTIRLFPDIEQVKQLEELSTTRNLLWNKLIDMEQTEYELNKKIIHNYSLDKTITTLRQDKPFSALNSKASQRISKEVYSSYKSFFKLIQKDKTAKPPNKIKEENITKFHTIIYNQSGWSIQPNNIIIINGIKLNYKSHLDLVKLKIKELKLKLRNNKWLCDVVIEDEILYKDIIEQENKILAIDLGLKNLANCIDNKGNVIIVRNKAQKIAKYYLKQIGMVQQKRSTKTKGSKKYKKLNKTIRNLYHKKTTQIKDTLHTQSKELLSMNYHTIVIGDLSVKRLMSTEGVNEHKAGIRKSFVKSNINMFLGFLTYKSYSYSTNIVTINEAYTTQTNSLTGKQFSPKIELTDRTVKLSDNIILDRDLNASINILDRYFNNHLALMAEPLDKTNVIEKFNLFNKPSPLGKPISL